MEAIEEKTYEYGIVGKIVYDPYAQQFDGDTVGEIAYLKRSSYELGTKPVSEERMDEIAAGIRSGELIGMPVYAYVHGGATIRCGSGNPFNCEWDSGMSGFVYCTKERGIEQCGTVEDALKALKIEVGIYDAYLTGQVFGYVVEDADGNHLDSCYGYYGSDELPYIRECMADAAQYVVEQERKRRSETWRGALHEAREKRYWAERDVVTA